ncbi:MAG TPA: hypothetical protein PKN61_13905 [Acidobacteriota bacterium]|jgi:hypothetical protein|nr:hypothetical protein [Acidobacteriota bacterium]HNR40124.1 hypothetical protein [Acidobacteriota bacterium]HNU01489.1 hypothetical protein [Acidobacteriota bacterium]HPB27877.1 hypothetical protein [Acidobacteriota bacterium]HQO26683.1 hypothetical protein [Acidobacteriota bacterium]
MTHRATRLLLVCTLTAGCLLALTAAVSVQTSLPADAKTSVEAAFAQAKADDVAILAPKKFASANKLFSKYQQAVRKGDKPDKLRQKADQAMAALKAANDAAALTRVALKDTLPVRQEALAFGGKIFKQTAFKDADKAFAEACQKCEKDEVKAARKSAQAAEEEYRKVTVELLDDVVLKDAKKRLDTARDGLVKETYKAAAQQVEGAKNYIDSVRKTPFGIAELTANVFDRIQKAYEISGLNK